MRILLRRIPALIVSAWLFSSLSANSFPASALSSAPPLAPAPLSACMPRPGDYTFMVWSEGWRAAQAPGHRSLRIVTGNWGLTLNPDLAQATEYGPFLDAPLPYEKASLQADDELPLPAAGFEILLAANGKRYRCIRGGETGADESRDWRKRFPFRLIESGRWLQRCDIQGLVFETDTHERLAADARLEVAAWPDRLSFLLDLQTSTALHDVRTTISLGYKKSRHEKVAAHGDLKPGGRLSAALGLDAEIADPVSWQAAPVRVAAFDPDTRTTASVTCDAAHGWYQIDLPKKNWSVASDFNHLDRLKLRLENPGPAEHPFRLCFAMDRPFEGVTGMSPMLRDADGFPTGIPVQISKNWHRWERPLLYQGPWFHGFTLVRVPARSALDLEFDIAYAGWGGVPAASHAQLCLIGWGTNQRWDQAAIGSWGESITYDPDVCLNRAMIDDVRPLMVTSMAPNQPKWTWTNNVGGGDFLVCFDNKNERQYLAGVRAAYLRYGPNLTGARYAGETPDGFIRACIDVSTPRCDDVNRAYHHFRYDFKQRTHFTRLAFYQLGADRYNDHTFEKIAYGNENGLIEEWTPEKGTLAYSRPGAPCTGRAPWFSLHEARDPRPGAKGAWANRGLIVRSWKARLGGKNVPTPYFAVYGTRDRFPSANIELVPPPGLDCLLPGDFVEAEVELVIVPQAAADYYGPNANLRAALAAAGDSWKPVHRLAKGNLLEIKILRGKLDHRYPVEIAVDKENAAALEITGGVGYVPLTFHGLPSPRGFTLFQTVGGKRTPLDQSVHGNDFWQADYDPVRRAWSLTFNVNLDIPGRIRLELN